MEKREWKMDTAICGLLKTMKSEYVEDTLNKGRLFFNFPAFYGNTELMSAQYDKYDSWETDDVTHIMFAPIVEENENGIKYGPVQKLADHGQVHLILEGNRHRPICCFRTIKKEDFVEKNNVLYYSLGDTAARIMEEFGHDSFVFIANPIELHRRINEHTLFYGHEVFYGKNNWEFQQFVDEVDLECCGMFQKDAMYAWQKEYRIVLSRCEGDKGFPIDIGSITDIAFGGKLEDLRDGALVFGEIEDIQRLQQTN